MQITINGKICSVHQNEIAHYVIYSAKSAQETSAKVEILLDSSVKASVIRPLSAGILPTVTAEKIAFEAPVPCKLSLEPDGNTQPIFFFLYAPEAVPEGENVRYYAAGEYTVDQLELHSNETLYLAEGAVLHAHLAAIGTENVTVCGRGIVDLAGDYSKKNRRMTHFYESKNLTVRDVTMTGSHGWCCAMWGCENVLIENVNIMTWLMCGDGVDVVGSHDVTVKNCFFRTADDCVAIKATDYCGAAGLQNVYNVTVKDCICWNAQPGNGIEIGFETRCDEMYNIEFSNIDLIHCEHEGWQSGGAITIHNGDRAKIHDVIYRDIRIEDVADKWFDFKVLRSNYSRDEKRGSVENVLVENVSLVGGVFPPSILSGFQPDDSLVRNIRFVNLSAFGEKIGNLTECRMVAERTKDISFEVIE